MNNVVVDTCEPTDTSGMDMCKKTKAVAKTVDTNKVLEYFKESIDTSNIYTLDEYKKLITAAFKEASKKTSKRSSKSGDEVVKREPTKYNIFVKEEILKLKAENPDKQYKDLMKMAADKWNENKLTA
jgi:20S proteasome alpha/beta subunit